MNVTFEMPLAKDGETINAFIAVTYRLPIKVRNNPSN